MIDEDAFMSSKICLHNFNCVRSFSIQCDGPACERFSKKINGKVSVAAMNPKPAPQGTHFIMIVIVGKGVSSMS